MNKKFATIMLTLLLTVMVVLSGCAKTEEPKAAMTNAAKNAMQMTSYEMKSKFVIEDLQINIPDVTGDPGVTQAMTMLKNAELTVDGIYQSEPQQMEMNMGVHLKGDMAMSINVDMVMTQEKIYIKIPSIPMIPFPEDVVGKFLVMDLQELAEQSGETFSPESMDTEKSQKFVNEVLEALLSEYDQAKYFKEIPVKDAGLPEGVEAKQVVQFFVTNDTLGEALEIMVNNVAPKVVDIAGKPEYRELLGLTEADIDEAKAAVAEVNQEEFQAGLEDMKKAVSINTFNVNTAIDKNDFPAYQDVVMNVDFNDPESSENVKLAIKGSTQYMNINAKQEFKIGIPTDENVITMEQFEESMNQMSTY
ncbi:hypothetical protein JCM10914A_20460 [Paenibacillus sp. JCM 10914]|uniref:hypothetical protein n=1 Tax=Paenibacillus sp. JCM 10914 TaxID=1236974 RepID=UPI0003CC7787|nr:hypothetical protein [Paenibacillus sp. JCM 10914]GAE09264.1 hypothetical protein JCM10914_5619 [Paenibacillus sp. JCM 10914]